MNVTEFLSKVKVMLSNDTKEVVEVKFAEYVLVDDTKVQTEGELEVGSTLSVVAEDGSLTPAPAAMHETNEGILITVGENGQVEAIEEAATEEVVEEAIVEEELEEVEVEVADEVAEPSLDLLQGIAELLTPFTEEIATLKEEVTALSSKFSELSDEPAAKPITRTFAEQGAAKRLVAEARIGRLAQLRNKK